MKTIQFKKQSSKAYRIIDLFAGIGGIRLGFESSGRYRTVFSSEIDRFARETYHTNFGEEPEGDITAIDADTIPDADVVVGGTPCQAFSLMGKRAGFEDARGTLFYDFLRVIRAKRPKAFLMENVAGLPSHDKGRTFRTMLGLFERAGYRTTHRILDARDFGLPQKRRRIFVVGFRNDIPADFGFPEGTPPNHALPTCWKPVSRRSSGSTKGICGVFGSAQNEMSPTATASGCRSSRFPTMRTP